MSATSQIILPNIIVLSSCRLSIRTCFCCGLRPILLFLMGLLECGVDGLPPMCSAVGLDDLAEMRRFDLTGAMLFDIEMRLCCVNRICVGETMVLYGMNHGRGSTARESAAFESKQMTTLALGNPR